MCSFFTDQPSAMNRVASQSSNSGWLGGADWLPKIVRRADEAFAEMMLPDAIDHHARGQRVVLVRDGIGEFEPAAAVAKRGRFGPDNTSRNRRGTTSPGVSAWPRMKIGESFGVGTVDEDVRAGRRAGIHQFQHVALFAQLKYLVACPVSAGTAEQRFAMTVTSRRFPLGIGPRKQLAVDGRDFRE